MCIEQKVIFLKDEKNNSLLNNVYKSLFEYNGVFLNYLKMIKSFFNLKILGDKINDLVSINTEAMI